MVFVGPGPRSIAEEAKDSDFVLFGTIVNAHEDANGGPSEIQILRVLKIHPGLKGQTRIRLSNYIPIPDPKNPPQYLVFGEVFRGKFDIYRGIPGNYVLADYVAGLMEIDPKNRRLTMCYCFNFLENDNADVAAEAFNEFLNSPDPDVRAVGRDLPAKQLRTWLQNEKTPRERLRLYGFLLGNCGDKEDAASLRKLLDKLVTQPSCPGADGILIGYTLLAPKDGWAYTVELLKKPSAPLTSRLAALHCARHFHTNQPEKVSDKEIVAALAPSLQQDDFGDLSINDLRKWKCWSLTEQILARYDRSATGKNHLGRAILRYALQCPDEQAVRFVAEQRKADHELVERVEEELALAGD